MIYKTIPGSKEQEWIKLRILESKLDIGAHFKYSLSISEGHKLYVNSNNSLILDFKDNKVALLKLSKSTKSHLSQVTSLLNLSLVARLSEPLYFSADFSSFFDLTSTKTSLSFFRLNETQTSYEPLNALNVPSIDVLAFDNQQLHYQPTSKQSQGKSSNAIYLIEFRDNTHIRYLTRFSNIE